MTQGHKPLQPKMKDSTGRCLAGAKKVRHRRFLVPTIVIPQPATVERAFRNRTAEDLSDEIVALD